MRGRKLVYIIGNNADTNNKNNGNIVAVLSFYISPPKLHGIFYDL